MYSGSDNANIEHTVYIIVLSGFGNDTSTAGEAFLSCYSMKNSCFDSLILIVLILFCYFTLPDGTNLKLYTVIYYTTVIEIEIESIKINPT